MNRLRKRPIGYKKGHHSTELECTKYLMNYPFQKNLNWNEKRLHDPDQIVKFRWFQNSVLKTSIKL